MLFTPENTNFALYDKDHEWPEAPTGRYFAFRSETFPLLVSGILHYNNEGKGARIEMTTTVKYPAGYPQTQSRSLTPYADLDPDILVRVKVRTDDFPTGITVDEMRNKLSLLLITDDIGLEKYTILSLEKNIVAKLEVYLLREMVTFMVKSGFAKPTSVIKLNVNCAMVKHALSIALLLKTNQLFGVLLTSSDDEIATAIARYVRNNYATTTFHKLEEAYRKNRQDCRMIGYCIAVTDILLCHYEGFAFKKKDQYPPDLENIQLSVAVDDFINAHK